MIWNYLSFVWFNGAGSTTHIERMILNNEKVRITKLAVHTYLKALTR